MRELGPELPQAFDHKHRRHSVRDLEELVAPRAVGQELRFELEIGEGAEVSHHPSGVRFTPSLA